jgi:hypothetical protein
MPEHLRSARSAQICVSLLTQLLGFALFDFPVLEPMFVNKRRLTGRTMASLLPFFIPRLPITVVERAAEVNLKGVDFPASCCFE